MKTQRPFISEGPRGERPCFKVGCYLMSLSGNVPTSRLADERHELCLHEGWCLRTLGIRTEAIQINPACCS